MDGQKREQIKEFLLLANALISSMEISIRSDPGNIWRYASYKEYMQKYNQLVKRLSQILSVDGIADLYNLDAIPSMGNTLAMQQKELFDSVHANLSVLKAYLENKIDAKSDEVTNLSNFLQVNVRKAVFTTPVKEVEIQDVVEQLLIGRGLNKGIDYDRETGRIKISVKEVVPDFIFPRLSLAIEVKLSKDTTKSQAIVDEINADIMSYSKKYAYILFLVYDLGSIRDETEFKQDLESPEGVKVIIVKH